MLLVFVKPVMFTLPKVHTFLFFTYEYILFIFGTVLGLQLQGLSKRVF